MPRGLLSSSGCNHHFFGHKRFFSPTHVKQFGYRRQVGTGDSQLNVQVLQAQCTRGG